MVEIRATSFSLSVGFKDPGTFLSMSLKLQPSLWSELQKERLLSSPLHNFYPNVFLFQSLSFYMHVHYMLFPADLPFRKVIATGNACPGSDLGTTIARILRT